MRVPVATYRLQFSPLFGWRQAQEIVPYLAALGISDIYASPIFQARPGSTHGYDVVDPTRLNPELGTAEDFDILIQQVKARNMGWLQDIVPNHMAYDGANPLLRDVLENGESSPHFSVFDIDWSHPYASLRGRVLAPFLGRPYGEALEAGDITLRYDRQGFTINYYTLQFPLKIESYIPLLTHRLSLLRRRLGEDHPDYIKFLGILYSLKNLPLAPTDDQERTDQLRFIKRMLWELYTENLTLRDFLQENISLFQGEAGKPESVNRLDHLLSEQHFRLAFWKVATEEINYRRFFNINELISLHMEEEEVFQQTHALIRSWIEQGIITGLRIDHIDGLYAPLTYLQRLRALSPDLYLVVEKILAWEEELPGDWPVQGTTGYEFLNRLNGLFCARHHAPLFQKIYTRFSGVHTPYQELVYAQKKLIMEQHMAGDVDNLAHLLKQISSQDRHGSDITLTSLKKALIEICAAFPIYRTYVHRDPPDPADRLYITRAIQKARERNPALQHELSFMERFLLLRFGDYLQEEERKAWLHFLMRFQQLTAPLMAKGFEDTTLYVYNRLLSLNEVGGEPQRFGTTLEEWHRFNRERAARWPHALNATATHDTKRGEDVRARLNVLSEIPDTWEKQLRLWSRLNRRKKRMVRGRPVPDRNDEYFLYQTLLGALPFRAEEYPSFQERLKAYIVKAVREAKVYTAWLKPDTAYEEAFLAFIDAILSPSPRNRFWPAFLPFQQQIAFYGIWNGLSQTLLKLTAPGVPDFYQGTEFWDLNLVDPDNRRPVDFDRRKAVLQEIKGKGPDQRRGFLAELLETREDGRIKLFLIGKGLEVRQSRPALFARGAYIPVEVEGRWREHIIAFARHWQEEWAISVAPRFLTSLIPLGTLPLGIPVWGDTHLRLPAGAPTLWQEAFSTQPIRGASLLVGEILQHFPVALLVNKERG